jgi:ATP-dependent Clp protease ATP-binding subunit ClpB
MGELRTQFRPEFLNRVDDIVLFKPLTLEEIARIVELQVDDLRDRLAGRRLELVLTDGARDLIARAGYDPTYGARPLRRYIQREVETRIGRALLSAEIHDGMTIVLDSDDGELAVTWRERDAGDPDRPEPVGATA